MDTVVQQLMKEYCAKQGLRGLSESDQFEVFATYCVLSDYTFSSVDATRFWIGGGSDGGIDGFAVAVNKQLCREPRELEAQLLAGTDAMVTIILVQAKTSVSMDRKFISELRVRVEYLLDTELKLGNAAALEPLRECQRLIRKHMGRLRPDGVRLVVNYVSTSPGANGDMLREAELASQALTRTSGISNVVFRCLGRDDLFRLHERAHWPSEASLTFDGHYPMPDDSGVTQARGGIVPARELMDALTDANGQLSEGLFSENIREFLPDAPVNDEIRATLRDPAQRRRFAVLNNGVTIVARSVLAMSDAVTMRDYQVVNGCQTCHVLAEAEDLLDGVSVKVQLFECDDDEVVDQIVMATNRQTEIAKHYFVNRRNLVKRLEIFYRAQRDQGRPLYLGRKPGKNVNNLRGGVISMSRQFLAYIAMFGEEPPTNARRDLKEEFDKRFSRAVEAEFYTAASALYRWYWLIDTKRVRSGLRSLGYQAIAALSVLHGARPAGGSKSDRKRRLEQIDAVLWSDGRWEREGKTIQSILDRALDAHATSDPKLAAGSQAFGSAVVALAKREASKPDE